MSRGLYRDLVEFCAAKVAPRVVKTTRRIEKKLVGACTELGRLRRI